MTDTDGWRHLAMEANRRAVALMQERDDLRAKVEALRDGTTNRTRDWDYFAALDDVLALFDGEQQR